MAESINVYDGRHAFAVSDRKRRRGQAYSPLSSEWTLYDPKPLAKELGVPTEDADRALERTGFNKAVRIREELIRWKERMRHEQATVNQELQRLNKRRRELRARQAQIAESLENVRNVLRLPREKDND